MKPLTLAIACLEAWSVSQSISQSVNQSVSQSISQSISQSVSQSVVHKTSRKHLLCASFHIAANKQQHLHYTFSYQHLIFPNIFILSTLLQV